MKKKDVGMLFVLALFIYMAVASDKLIPVTDHYYQFQSRLQIGEEIYQLYCRGCHERGRGGAPRTGFPADWNGRLDKEMPALIGNATDACHGERDSSAGEGNRPPPDPEETEYAVAYMVREVTKTR